MGVAGHSRHNLPPFEWEPFPRNAPSDSSSWAFFFQPTIVLSFSSVATDCNAELSLLDFIY